MNEAKYKNQFVRVYGLRINSKCYILTGGAIKLVEKMKQHPDLIKELDKLKQLRKILSKNHVIDTEGFFDYLEEIGK